LKSFLPVEYTTGKYFQRIVPVLFILLALCIDASANIPVNGASLVPRDRSQEDSTQKKPAENFYSTDSIFSFHTPKGYFPSLFNDIIHQAEAPFHFTGKQWIIVGASAGITIALFQVDGEIDEWARVQKQDHEWVNKLSPAITRLGADIGIYSVLGFGLGSAVFKNQKGVQTSLLATQAVITSGIWARLIKILTGRERPLADYTNSKSESGHWYGPFAMIDQDLAVKKPASSFDSFPSGHTATAFSIATVFATQYKDIKVVPVISYSLATLVGISRLTEHEHWSSDVFVGALLGWACGKQVTSGFNRLHSDKTSSTHQKSKNKPELTIIENGSTVGLSVRF
jgi:membrane-associated phospholipid phosphatase